MEIKTINKASYRKKVNIIIVGFVFLLVVSSIVCGAILIYFFGNHHIVPDQSTGNFYWNFLGVLLGLAITLTLVNSIKRWPYFSEVRYIWQLKQIQNKIYRKLRKLKAAANDNDWKAMTILKYYYVTLKEVYSLDNNTLTMSNVEKELVDIEVIETEQAKKIDVSSFQESWLDAY
ncbi:DUF3087 family protein [Vibrio sagamiensis]|uniref:Medium chain reductase/dehydrogenase n=1 Tax=Vibrio sagamiensis NBRC 104589 TaxID=1219064 RepID=A0A511QIX7_9VIBR|nr:DUF3087 family protein [Vibrio sagamiensis]PNQ60280.1 DUF3087 domain-containing protein [Vibrio agarivorans]GEM77280.1 medium chain reductase/dehydrogenase [Vibrio sagamiensis NBRC 104589]